MILPLATPADRTTQIVWGIRDFRHHFGRPPEGMWLPEAAVDLETLAIMARQGIRFTILSPYQAGRVRPLDDDAWLDVGDGSIDPRMPYVQPLGDNLSMILFFYDGQISRDVAFGNLLKSGEALARRLTGAPVDDRRDDQLVHIATDGETFGHHHRFGDLALAYALEKIDAGNSATLTNYAEFLEKRPPTWEVEIKPNTAWSCAHGLERWKSDCGCHSGRHPQWHQRWRRPLREALDGLREDLTKEYERAAARLFKNPRQVRNDYIDVILDRSTAAVDRFLKRHLRRPATEANCIRALKLLEMQRQAMLMYTSCGWFFDDLSGIETVQVIQYAGRAVHLAAELFDGDVETPFLEKLAAAKSNISRHKDGRHIYEKWVRPSRVDG
jgi:alpha-amylase/alpha-mannosidase (GH57 family)